MLKPELCPMPVECCEHCKEWEPIPFHDDGGVCMAGREMSVRRQCAPDSLNRSANIPLKARESLWGSDRFVLSKLLNTASFV